MDNKLEMNGATPGEMPETLGGQQQPRHEHGANLVTEGKGSTDETLKKLFESYGAAKTQTHAEAAVTHSKEWDGYESRAALLQKNAAYMPEQTTLTDKVRSLFGHR